MGVEAGELVSLSERGSVDVETALDSELEAHPVRFNRARARLALDSSNGRSRHEIFWLYEVVQVIQILIAVWDDRYGAAAIALQNLAEDTHGRFGHRRSQWRRSLEATASLGICQHAQGHGPLSRHGIYKRQRAVRWSEDTHHLIRSSRALIIALGSRLLISAFFSAPRSACYKYAYVPRRTNRRAGPPCASRTRKGM